MSDPKEIKFSLSYLIHIGEVNLAKKLLHCINEFSKEYNFFMPTRYGSSNPLKYNYNSENISEMLNFWMNEEDNKKYAADEISNGCLLMSKVKRGQSKRAVSYMLLWLKENRAHFNGISFILDSEILKEKNMQYEFLNLYGRIISIAEPIYGSISNSEFGVTMSNIKTRLPDKQWMYVLGDPYIKLLGKEKILSSPSHKIHVFTNNVLGMQVTENLYEPIPEESMRKLREHFGRDVFAEGNRRYKTGSAPDFDFSAVMFDKTKPMKELKMFS